MSNVGRGGGGGGGMGHGHPWGGSNWGGEGGWGGLPVGLPPMDPSMMMDPAMMAAAGYAEIVGWIPPPPRPPPPRPAPPGEHWGHEHGHYGYEHDHYGREAHERFHRWGTAGHEMAGSPMQGYVAGFLPDFEMGGSPMQGYTAGFLPDFEMGYTPTPGDQMIFLNDRRGLPAQGGYELGHVGHGTGQDPIRHIEHEIHPELGIGQPFHRRAWEEHAARRGWDHGHRHDDQPQQDGAPPPPAPPPPGDRHGRRDHDFRREERRDLRRDEHRRW